jgi:D-alanyl-D-alanine carboxypeptidase/D-alanyl-D-alanine-endopeptidase (penicillin-binding protein 4)
MTVPDPAAFALSVFRSVLEERGVTVQGRNRVVTSPATSIVTHSSITAPTLTEAPRTRTLARHRSPPLREYLGEVNKRSNNLYAELVFRTLGRLRGGTGSPQSASRAVADVLAELGVPRNGTVQVDGSGLSAENRIAPRTFVSLLSHLASSSYWTEFWHTLPAAGTRRELGRMYRTEAAGNLRAKTGTIDEVSALSGVVRSQDSERLAFSIMVNGTPSTTRAKRVENTIGVRLASFSRGSLPPGERTEVVPDPEGPPTTTQRYRVRSGESFTTIARRHRITLDELLRVNPDIEPRRLQAGQWILIPQTPQTPQAPAG